MTAELERRQPAATPEGMTTLSQYARWNLQQRVAYARTLAHGVALLPSGLRGNTVDETAAKLFIALETGDMLGLHPMAAIGGIDIIEGQPTVSPQLVLGLIRQAGHKVRIDETGSVETGDLKVTVTVIRTDDPDAPIVKSYTLHDALRAGLLDSYTIDPATGLWVVRARSRNGNPLNWEKYPADMCQWRAVGRVMRAGTSDILLGVSYFPEELEATVNAEGVRVEAADPAEVDEYIARIKELDDKADMSTLWHEINKAEKWTPKLREEFDGHLMTLTKDSRPPQPGAPGQTGNEQFDGNRAGQPATAPETPEQGEQVDTEPIDVETATGPHSEPGEVDADAWEAAEIAAHEAELRAARGE